MMHLGIAALLLLAAGAAGAQSVALRADLWCPYNCEPDAAEQGYFVDAVRAALPEARVNYALGRWHVLSRQKSRPPEPVLLLLGVAPSAASDRRFIVLQPALAQAHTCAYRRAAHPWELRSPADLQGQRLGVTLGYQYHPTVDALLADPRARRLITQVDADRASLSHARMLSLGRVDVVLEDRAVMRWALRQPGVAADIVEAGCLPHQPDDALHLALPSSDPRSEALARTLEARMQALQRDGTLQRLREHYGLGP